MDSHLTYPSESSRAANDRPSPPPTHDRERKLLTDRLYIGNLHPTVDEYTLLQVFSKFGKITKLDFLFHKTGPCKGKPRGYAFVEYSSAADAQRALGTAHDKLLRGRKLVVTFAQQAPMEAGGLGHGHGGVGGGHRFRKGMMEAGRPTTLSMLKSGLGSRNDGTKDKIAMMEAKLRQMEHSTPGGSSSLPSKPSYAGSSQHRPPRGPMQVKPRGKSKGTSALPALPIVPAEGSKRGSSALSFMSHTYGPVERQGQGQGQGQKGVLAGVRIGKLKGA